MTKRTKWSDVPRCKADFCGGACELIRAQLRCLACNDVRPATPEEARLALLAWSEVAQ